MQKEDLKNSIKKHLVGLYLLRASDILLVESRLDDLPDSALAEILDVLKRGVKKQNDFLMKMNAKDKKFNLNLEKVLENSYKKASCGFTGKEQREADEILKQL